MKALIIGHDSELVEFPRSDIETGHTLWSWGESVDYNFETKWVGDTVINSVLALGTSKLIDLNEYDVVLVDSWVDSGNDFLWKELIEEYEGVLVCIHHYPSGYNVEEMSRADRSELWKRNARFDAVFQPSLLSEGYYPNAKMFHDIIWPIPVNLIMNSIDVGHRREDVATLMHTYDMSGSSFRFHFNTRFLIENGYKVEYTTKQPERTDEFNEHIQIELGMTDAFCVGWLGDQHTQFVNTCSLMFEMQLHPSVSSAIAKAAACKIPSIGSSNPYQDNIFPNLVANDVTQAKMLIETLRSSKTLLDDVIAVSQERLEMHSISSTAIQIHNAVGELIDNRRAK